ncbi:hypothetical protein HDE_07513 [Halotydeus destructor]|nr:hypothetical protein HDE_07513 [Halotydeus destructor]
MHQSKLIQLSFLLILVPNLIQSMIMTSVYGGRKKFKTISFDFLPFLPPLVYEKPHKLAFAYRGHYTIKPPNFKFKLNIPVPAGMVRAVSPSQSHYDTNQYADEQYDHYDTQPTNEEEQREPSEEDNEEEDQSPEQSQDSMESYPAYIRNGGHNHKSGPPPPPSQSLDKEGDPRPYTGKAQVSSFIDNGQFVTATKDNMDAAFSDQPDDEADIRRTKTIPLGYSRLRDPPKPPTYFQTVASHPDSLPYGMGYTDLQKYYTTFQFTDSLRGPYQPYVPRKSFLGITKLVPSFG